MFCVARYVRCRHKVNVRRKVQQTSDVNFSCRERRWEAVTFDRDAVLDTSH